MAKRIFDRDEWMQESRHVPNPKHRKGVFDAQSQTCAHWNNCWTRNIDANAAAGRIAAEYSIVTDYGTQNGPVLIVGAGPSFFDNLDLIKGLSESSVKIIAVDRVYRPLKEMGIKPFLTVSLDAQGDAMRFFKGVKIKEDERFALSSITHPDIWEYVEKRTTNIKHHGHINPFAWWWNLAAKRYGEHILTTSSGTVVTHNAVDIAYWMGFDEIYTLGNDLCYRTKKEAKEDTGGYKVIKVDGKQTIIGFAMAAKGFYLYKKLHKDVKLIDCSGGLEKGWTKRSAEKLMRLAA